MASQSSKVRSTRLRGYEARIAELTEAFNLPGDLNEFVTLSMRDGDVDVKVGASASKTVTSVDVDCPAALKSALKALLDEHRERLHVNLKRDLAVNLLAAMTDRSGE
jgi:hypothetical protein